MLRLLSKYVVGWIVLVITSVSVVLVPPAAAADDGNAFADQVAAVFHRSMAHWKLDYTKQPNRKAGVACIQWGRLDAAYLDSGIFEALGFSYSMAEDEGAINVATQGCERMRTHYKVPDCVCEVVFIGEAVAVTVPEGVGE